MEILFWSCLQPTFIYLPAILELMPARAGYRMLSYAFTVRKFLIRLASCLVIYGTDISRLTASPLTILFQSRWTLPENIELQLTSRSGESVQVRGDRITLELLGEPKYIEDFPGI